MIKLRDALYKTNDCLKLASSNIPPINERKIILKNILQQSDESISSNLEKNLEANDINTYKSFIIRRINNEPLAQIIKNKNFWKNNFFINDACLIPRFDSEVIVEAVIKTFKNKQQKLSILDIGTGSGCLIISLLNEYKKSFGVGIDTSVKALQVANINKIKMSQKNRLRLINTSYKKYDSSNFDIIVTNPPYISKDEINKIPNEVKNFEPLSALYAQSNGLKHYKEIMLKLQNPKKKQIIFFEIGHKQSDAVTKLLKNNGFRILDVLNDLSGIPRCIVTKKIFI